MLLSPGNLIEEKQYNREKTKQFIEHITLSQKNLQYGENNEDTCGKENNRLCCSSHVQYMKDRIPIITPITPSTAPMSCSSSRSRVSWTTCVSIILFSLFPNYKYFSMVCYIEN